jgi:hypothetical protein
MRGPGNVGVVRKGLKEPWSGKTMKSSFRSILSSSVVISVRGYCESVGRGTFYFGILGPYAIGADTWVRCRLHSYLWRQWGRRGYRELVNRGVSRELAWDTVSRPMVLGV